MLKKLFLSLALVTVPFIGGCESTDDLTADAGTTLDSRPNDGPTLFGLSAGDACYTITAIEPGYSDGCKLGVETLINMSLPMNYASSTATVTLGTSGSLGGGVIANNKGTLIRDGNTTFSGTTCTLHQKNTTEFELTANNKFKVTVTEVQSDFGPTCGADAPTGGTCTSTWTWTMQKATDTSLVPPACGS